MSLMSSRSRAAGVFALLFLALVISAAAQETKPSAQRAPSKIVNRLSAYQPVTADRLKNPEDGNWLAIRRTYDGWGYSPLTQITTANVARLKPVWNIPTG